MRRFTSFVVVVLFFLSCDPVEISIAQRAYAAGPSEVVKLALAQAATDVTWTATAGTIAPDGTLTAPGCTATLPVTITVTATSGTRKATATVDVADRVTGITVTPATASVAPGGTVAFVASVKTTCNPGGTATALRATAPTAAAKAVVK